MEKTSRIAYPDKKNTFKISRAIIRVTAEVFSPTEILLPSTVKRLVGEKGRFLKRE